MFTLEMLVLELIFVPEQDCSAALLKAERIKLDRFLKQSRPSLNTFVELKLQQGFLLVNSRLQQLGPDLIRKQLSVACPPAHAFQAEEQAKPNDGRTSCSHCTGNGAKIHPVQCKHRL